MGFQDLERLDKLDLSKLSVSDIRGLKNQQLKRVLATALERGDKAPAGHQDHSSHGDHDVAP